MKRLIFIGVALAAVSVAHAGDLATMEYETMRHAADRHDAQMDRGYAESSAKLQRQADEAWRDMSAETRALEGIHNELMIMNNR